MKKLKIFFVCNFEIVGQKQSGAIWMGMPVWSMRLYSSLIAQYLQSSIRNSCKFKFKDTFCALIISKHFCSDNLLCVCLLGFYLGNCRRRWTKGIKSFEGCLRHHIWILVRIAAEIPSGGKKALSIHYTVPSHLYIVKRYYVYKVRRHGTVYIYRGAWKKKYGLPWPVTACLNQHSDRAYCFLQ